MIQHNKKDRSTIQYINTIIAVNWIDVKQSELLGHVYIATRRNR